MKGDTVTDWGPLMSEDADWWAVPGHVPPARMLRQLIDEGMIEGPIDDVCLDYGGPCEHGDDDCDCKRWVPPWRRVLLRWARQIEHTWVRQLTEEGEDDEDVDWTGGSGWWVECDADHPSAEPATVWTW